MREMCVKIEENQALKGGNVKIWAGKKEQKQK